MERRYRSKDCNEGGMKCKRDRVKTKEVSSYQMRKGLVAHYK